MTSLVDIARAMDKPKATQEQKLAVATASSEPASKPTTLSLVDIAKEQQLTASTASTATTKPLTLVDVARKADAAQETATAVSLQSLAREINEEERHRVDAAITKAATDVKQEKAQQRAEVLKAATKEVLHEEQAVSQKPKQTKTPEASPSDRLSVKTSPAPVPSQPPENDGGDDDGYSSFEDDKEKKKKASAVVIKGVNKGSAKRVVVEEEQEDNQSESGGPEKTTPSDSPLAKEFLRAIYRGDARRVRDMMRDDALDASTADQHGWSALHWAASQGQGEILSLLLERSARVDAVEHVNGWTALHLAVMRDAVSCAKKLLRAGARTTICDSYGDSAVDLLRAVKGKQKERWLLLLDNAARHK